MGGFDEAFEAAQAELAGSAVETTSAGEVTQEPAATQDKGTTDPAGGAPPTAAELKAHEHWSKEAKEAFAALASDVELLILDEPTSGLDPLMEKAFQQCVTEVSRRGAAVLLSSHILAETEALCDRITIIRAGRMVETGSLDSMRHLSRTTVTAELLSDPGDLSRIPGVENISYDGPTLHAEVDSAGLGEFIRAVGQAGVRSLVSRPPTLEDLFLRHYGTEAVHA